MSSEQEQNPAVVENEQQEQQGPPPIESLEEAVRNREVGVQLYNKNLFEAALAIQMRVLEYYTKTYGDISAEAGLPYLDYAITLLTIIQTGTTDADAALAGNIGNEELEEDLELCYQNLDSARVCFEKNINQLKKDDEAKNAAEITLIQKRLAEVHDTMADYFMEVDDEESAINSYTAAIELRETCDAGSKAIISGHYRIGKAYYRLQIFEQAAASYKKAVDLAEAAPAGSIDSEFIDDLKESLEDAEKTVKDGGLTGVREEVEQMFPSQDSESGAPASASPGKKGGGAKKNPLIEVITKDPLEDSLQLAPDVVIPLLPTDASNSMSHFPSQGHSRASAGGSNNNNNNKVGNSVNTNVVMRRKNKDANNNNNNTSSSNSQQKEASVVGSRREREGEQSSQPGGSQPSLSQQ